MCEIDAVVVSLLVSCPVVGLLFGGINGLVAGIAVLLILFTLIFQKNIESWISLKLEVI